jgi:hypothetical protein
LADVVRRVDIHKAVFQAVVLDPDSRELRESRFQPAGAENSVLRRLAFLRSHPYASCARTPAARARQARRQITRERDRPTRQARRSSTSTTELSRRRDRKNGALHVAAPADWAGSCAMACDFTSLPDLVEARDSSSSRASIRGVPRLGSTSLESAACSRTRSVHPTRRGVRPLVREVDLQADRSRSRYPRAG